MALKLAGKEIGIQEKIGSVIYTPELQDTADLETGTHTIVPTARPAIAAAQYSKTLTLPKPDNARLVVKRIAARLSVNTAGLGTATHVYCSVRVDVDDTDHELFSEDWESTGAKLDAVDTHSAAKSTILNLLKDGAAHTFYFLFWADVANQATIDVVQLWEGVGICSTSLAVIMPLDHVGFLNLSLIFYRKGTGSRDARLAMKTDSSYIHYVDTTTGNEFHYKAILCDGQLGLVMKASVATDLFYVYGIHAVLRSQQ